MNVLVKKSVNLPKKKDGVRSSSVNGAKTEFLGTDSSTDNSGGSSSSRSCCENFAQQEGSAKGSSSPSPLGWPIRKATLSKTSKSNGKLQGSPSMDSKPSKVGSKTSEMDMMKERFAKLLLGEDMSGSGKGVSTALAISNAITNLCASIFGQLWRLEPLQFEKKEMWHREMECLLCVSDHIVELVPSWQTFPDGKKLEVMACRPRSDLFINLPALRKLDNLLLEILDSFTTREFWYVDQGIVASDSDGSSSFRRSVPREEEKWWLPVPRVPANGLSENSRKQLDHTRECASQILKAAMAINSIALAEMEVPESYLEGLPKAGRSCLGDVIYHYVTSDQFSPESLLDCLDLSSEHIALDIANRVEAAIYVWRRRAHSRPPPNPNRSTTKSSWEMVRDLVIDVDKRELLAERAESLLLCLKHRFPGLTQTSLDASKIQSNKDVGKSILESYSRVLESMSFSIVARIDDVLYIDDFTKQTAVSVTSHQDISNSLSFSIRVSGTPFKTAFGSPRFVPAPVPSISPAPPARGDRTPFPNSTVINKAHRRGFGVRRVLTNYLGVEAKAKICSHLVEGIEHKNDKKELCPQKTNSVLREKN